VCTGQLDKFLVCVNSLSFDKQSGHGDAITMTRGEVLTNIPSYGYQINQSWKQLLLHCTMIGVSDKYANCGNTRSRVVMGTLSQ